MREQLLGRGQLEEHGGDRRAQRVFERRRMVGRGQVASRRVRRLGGLLEGHARDRQCHMLGQLVPVEGLQVRVRVHHHQPSPWRRCEGLAAGRQDRRVVMAPGAGLGRVVGGHRPQGQALAPAARRGGMIHHPHAAAGLDGHHAARGEGLVGREHRLVVHAQSTGQAADARQAGARRERTRRHQLPDLGAELVVQGHRALPVEENVHVGILPGVVPASGHTVAKVL
ncbi:hypothetical protein D3C72_1439600 [compost metagenome]